MITKATINSLQAQYNKAQTEVRKRIQSNDFSPLSDEGGRLNTALTRTLKNLDELFQLADPLSTEFSERERELIADYEEGSTNLAEYKIGRAYHGIYYARELIYKALKILPSAVSKASTPQVIKDIYELSDFICTKLIPLMNTDQINFYSSANKNSPLFTLVNDFNQSNTEEELVSNTRRNFFEFLEKGDPITIDGRDFVLDSVDAIGPNYFLAQEPGGTVVQTFDIPNVVIEARGQRLKGDEVTPIFDQILENIDNPKIYMWKIIPIINNNIDKFNPEERTTLQDKLADRWIKEFASGGAVNLKSWAKDYEAIFTGFSGQKAIDLCNKLTQYYISCIQRGQLKDAVGIGAALDLFGLDDVKVDLADAQRFQFLLMHLPKEFWYDLSQSSDGVGGLLPVAQTTLKGYLAIGAPQRPALNAFQAKMLAIANEIQRGGNGNRLITLQRFVAAERNGLVATVFKAEDEADEARQIRTGIRNWLIKQGETVPAEGKPLPLKFHPASARFRAANSTIAEERTMQEVTSEVQAAEADFWSTLAADPERALEQRQARVADAHAKLNPHGATNIDAIFEGSDRDPALNMIGGGDDGGLQKYLREVLRLKVQSYFPNTVITDSDVNDIRAMRETVLIMLGQNSHMESLKAEERADIFRPLGLGANLESLDVDPDRAVKLLEYQHH